jgi:hypothetical protein
MNVLSRPISVLLLLFSAILALAIPVSASAALRVSSTTYEYVAHINGNWIGVEKRSCRSDGRSSSCSNAVRVTTTPLGNPRPNEPCIAFFGRYSVVNGQRKFVEPNPPRAKGSLCP